VPAALRDMATTSPPPSDSRLLAVRLFGPHRSEHGLDTPDPWNRSAVHESGHAIVCVLVGGTFSHVTTRLPVSKMEDAMMRPWTPTPDASIATCLGGPMAELLVFGALDPQATGFDVSAALRLALGDEGRARAGATKAMDLLVRRRGALKQVARVLLQRGGSTLAECQRIVGADEGTGRG
jgi:hypothetical protein